MSDHETPLNADLARIDQLLQSMTDQDMVLEDVPDGLFAEIEAAVEADDTATNAEVVPISAARRNRSLTLAAVAAAFVVIVGLVALSQRGDDIEVVGEASLGWQDGFVAEGVDVSVDATIVTDGDQQSVRIEQADLPVRADEDLELWLIGVDADGELVIQTLGVIDDPAVPGTYAVPEQFESSAFETVLVDISFEPRDGVEAHSGASIVRGPVVESA